MNKMTEKMMKKSADMALEMTAKMMGMDKSTVAKIVQVGMPMQMKMISENPDMAKQMYAASFKLLPDQVQDFYRNLLNDPKLAEVSQEEYKQVFGASAQVINEAAAAEAGDVSAAQAGQVMGTMMPEFKATVKEEAEAAGVDEKEFGSWMGEQAEEEA